MTQPGALLETRGLQLSAASRVLVLGLDWRVEHGERWCVIGRNGAGKSLLLRALAGLAVPGRAGEILWQGRLQSTWRPDAAAALRAYMPQQAQDRFALTVARVLALSHVARIDEREGEGEGEGERAAIDDVDVDVDAGLGHGATRSLLEALDIAGLAQRRVDRLSGGERQRVALAQCFAQSASLMLLDEPVSFQDPAHRQRVARWLAGVHPFEWGPHDKAVHSATWIASAHDPGWIARAATHVLALFGDGAWQAGAVDDVLTADVLARTYDCGWRCVDGTWVPD